MRNVQVYHDIVSSQVEQDNEKFRFARKILLLGKQALWRNSSYLFFYDDYSCFDSIELLYNMR